MKRTSKLLAILLSLCVLFAAVATFALAAETSPLDASQYGEGINMVASNADGLKSGYLGGNANSSYKFESITGDGNTYTKLTRKPLTYAQMTASKMLEKPNKEDQFSNGYQGVGVTATELKNFDYLVWSVDFMSEAVGENGKLNYLDESWFGTYGNAYYRYHIVKDADGDWFMSSDSEYSSDDAPLATEPGAWNNLTVVISRANGKQYAFANGRSFGTVDAPSAFKIDRIVYNIWASYDIYNSDWSISIDNVSFNSYATGYSSGNKYGLDDYFANADLTKYISDCEDVVYNSGYKLPSAPAAAEYTVTDDGVSKTYTSHSAVARLIPDLGAGDEIISDVKLDTLLDAAGRSYVKAETASHSIIYTITGAAPAASDDITKGAITFFTPGGTSSAFEYYYEEAGKDLVTGTMVSKDFFGVRNGTAFTGNASNTNYNFFLAPSGKTDKTSYPTSADYKYVTLGFDIAAAGYVYLPDGATDGIYRYIGNIDSLTETEKATARLSYWENGRIALFSNVWDFAYYYICQDGQWYLSANDKTYSADDVPLSNNVGEWNSIYFVNEVASGKTYVYVNGRYATTGKLKATEFERISFLHLEGVGYSECDMRIGNIDANFYKNSYDSGDNVFGIDDFFALGDPAKYDASFIEDASFGVNSGCYGIPANVKVVRGDETLYYKSIAHAFKAAKTGDTVYYDGALDLFRPINQDIESLNVVADSVTLEGDALYLHDYADGVITRKSVYTATWIDENGETVKVELVGVGSIPNFEAISFDTSYMGNYNQAAAWKWALKGEDTYAALSTLKDVAAGSEIVLVPDIVSVGWFDVRNNLLASEKWFAGSVASRDFSELGELEVLDNGWYELSYFWNSSKEDMTLKSGEGRSFSPVIEPVDAFTGLKYNFTLGTYFYINHYVPVPEEDIGVSVTGAKFAENCNTGKLSASKPYYDDLSEATSKTIDLGISKTVSIGDMDYYKFENEAGIVAYSWYAPQGFELCYTVEFDGVEYELTSKVALTRFGQKEADKNYCSSYVYTVLNNSECGSKEIALIVNLARYISQSYALQGSLITFGDVDNILKSHKTCDCVKSLESYMPTEAPATDTSGLAIAKGFAAAFRTNAATSALAIYVPKEFADANSDLSIKAEINGAIVNGATRLQTLTLDFYMLKDSEDNPILDISDGVTCYVYAPAHKDNAVYNADLVYNITVSCGGNEYKGTYSLATYLYNLNRSLGLYVYDAESGAYVKNAEITTLNSSHRTIQALLAQRAYAEAARNYKLN